MEKQLHNVPPPITDQDRDILIRLMNGSGIKEISADLKLHRTMINARLSRLRAKFDCKNTIHLVTVMMRGGLLK